jgi:hypothetical protein
MNRTRKALIAGGVVGAAVIAGGTTFVLASDEEDNGPDVPIPAEDLDQASAAALAYTGGGRVTETEVGDEESYYEVEVTMDDGKQVDVQLDEQFHVVSSSADNESAGED